MRTFQEIRFHHSNSFQNVDHRQSELAHLAYNIGRAHVGLEEKDMGLASYLDAIDRYSLSHMHIGNGLLSKCSHDIPTFKKGGVEDKQAATMHDQIAGIYVEKGDYDQLRSCYTRITKHYLCTKCNLTRGLAN